MTKLTKQLNYLAAAYDIEAQVIKSGGVVGHDSETVCPVKHSFGEGCYVREWNSPPGMLVVSKLHKIAHPYFILEGDISVATEDGLQRIKAPHYGITPAGTKRVLYTHSQTKWVTVHVTEETDIEKIEAEIIAADPSELRLTDESPKELAV